MFDSSKRTKMTSVEKTELKEKLGMQELIEQTKKV